MKLYFRNYVAGFVDVLRGKTSLNLYLAMNYPSLFKLKRGEVIRWKKHLLLSDVLQEIPLFDLIVLKEIYAIPECSVKEGDVVFDVGAHLGFFSYHAKLKGARKIYAFEPNPYAVEILKKHALLWGMADLVIQNCALYSEKKEIELFIPRDPLASISTILSDKRGTVLESFEYSHKIKVKATTIDDFVKENGIERVDFIKIDAEGAEREIIRGAKETIKKFKPRMVTASYHLPDDREAIPELILSIRDDYRYKLVNKGEEDLFFY